MLWTTQSCGRYEQLGILWAKASRCYEQLRVVDDMNDFRSWDEGSRCYKQLKVVDDMNELESLELRPLDAMKSLGVLIIWTILSRVAMAPNALKNSWL